MDNVPVRLVMPGLIKRATLRDAVVVALPDNVGVCWEREEALNGFADVIC